MSVKHLIRGGLAAALWLSTVASAQPTPPASQPATRPTTAPAPDPSTPRGALRALAEAMRDGDADAVKQSFDATSKAEEKMVDAMASMAAALAELHRSAVKAFGEQEAKRVTGDTEGSSAEALARIDAADVSVNGDSATVKYPEEKESFLLKRVEGRWKVPAAEVGKPADPAALEQRLADLTREQKLAEQIAKEIGGGKYATAEKAADAWHSRMLELAVPRPTTTPAERVGDATGPR